jgi:hypothetical protein
VLSYRATGCMSRIIGRVMKYPKIFATGQGDWLYLPLTCGQTEISGSSERSQPGNERLRNFPLLCH